MNKFIGYISIAITILGIIIGGFVRFASVEAAVKVANDKVTKVEEKIEKLQDANADKDKTLVELNADQKYIKENVDELKSDIKELIKQLKTKR